MPGRSYSSLHSRASDINASMGSNSRLEDPALMTSIDSADMTYAPETMKTVRGRKTFSGLHDRESLKRQQKEHAEAITQMRAAEAQQAELFARYPRYQNTNPSDRHASVFWRQVEQIRRDMGLPNTVSSDYLEQLHPYTGGLYQPPPPRYHELGGHTRDYRTQIQFPEAGFTIADAPAHVKKFAKRFKTLSSAEKAFHTKYPRVAEVNHAVVNPLYRAMRNDPYHPARTKHLRPNFGKMVQKARATVRARRSRAGSVASTSYEVQRPIRDLQPSIRATVKSTRHRSVGRKSAGRKSAGRKSTGRKSAGRKKLKRARRQP